MGTNSPDSKQARLESMCDKFNTTFKVPEITAAEWQRCHEQGPQCLILLDCRNADEQEVSRIPGSITKAEYAQRQNELGGQPVLCYCTVGYRSSEEAQKLARSGVNASNMRGGILAWTHSGQQLVTGADASPTRRVHTYSEKWALQADGYEPVAYSNPPLRMAQDFIASKLKFW